MKTDYEKTLDAIASAQSSMKCAGARVTSMVDGFTKEMKFALSFVRISAKFHTVSGRCIDPSFSTLRRLFAAIEIEIEE